MVAATKQEVMNYLDQMDESSVFRVLLYAKSLFSRKKPPKSPYASLKPQRNTQRPRNCGMNSRK